MTPLELSSKSPRKPIAPNDIVPVGLDDPARFLNRDLQWLEFNCRVLAQGDDPHVPLLERVRFLAIFGSNLDEFFMKRVGGLRRQIDAGVASPAWEPLSPEDQVTLIRERTIAQNIEAQRLWRDVLVPELAAREIHLLAWNDLTKPERVEVEAWYRRNLFPILTPLAVDPGHRFPFISNMSVSLGVMLRRPGESEQLFARVKVPEFGGHLYRFADSKRFIPLQEVIAHNLDDLFPGMEIIKVLPFRVTRNAETERDNEDAEDLLELIQQQLRERRFARVVRLEVATKGGDRVQRFLEEELELSDDDIYEVDGLLDWEVLNEIADIDAPELHWPTWTPLAPPGLEAEDADIFGLIRKQDILVHHPYQSFDHSVERFIEAAAADPKVLAIKQVLYRTSGDSPFIPSLIRAAEAGKQVAVLVELRARFDEARNIVWARKLEDAGVHVAYGVVGLKTHTKVALVVRQEADSIRCYAHVGTGNYNSKTARLYEDIGLLTCDSAITEDLVGLFNYMTGRSRQKDYQRLLIAPVAMKRRFLELIDEEVEFHQRGQNGRIIVKMNQLEDRSVTDALYRASKAGVSIDIICRGFCCVRPGVPNLSESIRVYSTIGRFLEHSRIFWFGRGAADPLDGEFYIGSADWMYRNLNTRVECATPIAIREHRERLWQILQMHLNDRRQQWRMASDGAYTRASTAGVAEHSDALVGPHVLLMRQTFDAQHARSH
ncbi:MAG: polyphosphate kinase 1 [Planctomycetota bacterium]|nr:MAG: polyphosphate kinase 1 [Planctomycetota bacterium]RLS95751.1 MAG: polyphosphate kinase 1 [Planctomycetota bacterium]